MIAYLGILVGFLVVPVVLVVPLPPLLLLLLAAAAGCERRSIDWTDWSSVVVVPNSVAELKLATLFGYCSFSYRSALAVYICRSPIVALNGSE